MEYKLFTISAAYILDLLFGDPQLAWHPIRIIGGLIGKFEKRLNSGNINKKFSGMILVVLIIGITVFCIWGMLELARRIHPVLYYSISILLIYFSLSVKSLSAEANKVYRALRANDIAQARKGLSMIVARDTGKLDEPEIIRATVETVAESSMDGIVAPLFYAFLGGPVLAWAYKAINTLDSMVGYRNARFINFGRFAAKVDGWANLIPAKLTCLVIFISSWYCRKNWRNCARWVSLYFMKSPGDNSEAAEASMAGALGVRLGGLNFYDSAPVEKKLIGENLFSLDTRHIKESISISYVSSGVFMAMGITFIWLMGRR